MSTHLNGGFYAVAAGCLAFFSQPSMAQPLPASPATQQPNQSSRPPGSTDQETPGSPNLETRLPTGTAPSQRSERGTNLPGHVEGPPVIQPGSSGTVDERLPPQLKLRREAPRQLVHGPVPAGEVATPRPADERLPPQLNLPRAANQPGPTTREPSVQEMRIPDSRTTKRPVDERSLPQVSLPRAPNQTGQGPGMSSSHGVTQSLAQSPPSRPVDERVPGQMNLPREPNQPGPNRTTTADSRPRPPSYGEVPTPGEPPVDPIPHTGGGPVLSMPHPHIGKSTPHSTPQPVPTVGPAGTTRVASPNPGPAGSTAKPPDPMSQKPPDPASKPPDPSAHAKPPDPPEHAKPPDPVDRSRPPPDSSAHAPTEHSAPHVH